MRKEVKLIAALIHEPVAHKRYFRETFEDMGHTFWRIVQIIKMDLKTATFVISFQELSTAISSMHSLKRLKDVKEVILVKYLVKHLPMIWVA